MKKLCALILISAILVCLPGCWDILELNEIGLVLLIGIDHDPKGDGFEVTVHVQAPLPGGGQDNGSSGNGSGQNTWITSARGQTILDAFRNLRSRAAFQLSFHHARLIIIGEDLARKGISPTLDHMLRTRELRLNSLLLVCEGTAKDLLQIKPEVAEGLPQELEGILRNESVWSKSISVQLYEFVQNYLDPGIQPVAGRLLSIKPEVGTPIQSQEENGGEIVETVISQGAAVFNDDQLVDWLTGTETIGFRYITSIGGVIILIVPWHGALASLEVRMVSCSKTAVFNNGVPTMRLKIYLTGTLLEYTGYVNLKDSDIISEVEKLAADQVANILRSADQKAKDLGVDFLGYGGIISRNYPNQWSSLNKNWRETFPTIDTVFDIRIKLVHPGTIVEPLPK